MGTHRQFITAIVIGLLILTGLTSMQAQAQEPPDKQPDPAPDTALAQFSDTVLSIWNAYLRVDANSSGRFVIGTTGGDPAIESDNDKRLMFGFRPDGQSLIGTSFASFQIITGTTPTTITRSLTAPTRVTTTTDEIVTIWNVDSDVQIQQTLSFVENSFSSRDDIVKITYHVTNQAVLSQSVGIRYMLDTMVGSNDRAPFFIPGVGNSNKEQEFLAGNIPPRYTAFESEEFDRDSLKGMGLLTGPGLTVPDRFLVASWPRVQNTTWDYEVDPESPHGDSATVMYWYPVPLGPGESATFATAYGLPGNVGGRVWVDAPVTVPDTSTEFEATFWVNNVTDEPFTDGIATITLPDGLQITDSPNASLASQILTQPIGDVPPGEVQQINWDVVVTGGSGTYSYDIEARFTSGEVFTTTQQVDIAASAPGEGDTGERLLDDGSREGDAGDVEDLTFLYLPYIAR